MDVRKLKFVELLFPKRPKCPRCGSGHVISRGIEWGCGDCGRRWAKRENWGKSFKKEERVEEREDVDGEAATGED